jgi:iron(II)-dependent oxidoreductase
VSTLDWTSTPITNRHLDLDAALSEFPVTGIGYGTATDIASRLGGRLPSSVEWEWMAAGVQRRTFPWGDEPWNAELACLAPAGHRCPGPVGAHPGGATADGLLDVAGNVWEWTATPVMGGGYVIRGGSYASVPLYAQCTFRNAAPAELASPGIGLRVVRQP